MRVINLYSHVLANPVRYNKYCLLYRPRDLQHLHTCTLLFNMVDYITHKIHQNNTCVKYYTNNYTYTQLKIHTRWLYLNRTEISCLTFTCELCVFFNGRSKRNCKMLTYHVSLFIFNFSVRT